MNIEFQKNGAVLIVKPAGRIDAVSSAELDSRIREEAEGISELIMDLEAVDYISSTGLRIILAWYKEMEKRCGTMKILHVSELVKEVFDLTGFLDFLTIE